MRTPLLAATLTLVALPVAAAGRHVDDWPTTLGFQDGTELAATANIAYDFNTFSGDARLQDRNDFRRKEVGATLKKKGVYDAMVYFDFESKLWLDVFLRLETKAMFGSDYGRLRVGYIKVPLGMDGIASSRAGSFLELGLPTQAIFESRRTGVEWALERPHYAVQAGAYGGQDLQGDNPGTTQALRGIWLPVHDGDQVLHLGLATSLESPRGYHDGRGVSYSPRVRLRARPEAGLTDVRLIDSGTLVDVDHVLRSGAEGLWINGPFSVQAEALRAKVARDAAQGDYVAHGEYLYGTWTLTGESRPYTVNGPGNIKPEHDYGAVELVARYSHLNLDDGGVHGGRQHDLTVGANWYLTSHVKVQANYTRTDAAHDGLRTRPHIVEVRGQVMF